MTGVDMDKRGSREPGTIATVVLTLLLLGFLVRLVIGVIRDFWVILIALLQP